MKGKGGSMHIADFSIGILGANGIVAAGLPIIYACENNMYGVKSFIKLYSNHALDKVPQSKDWR